MRLPKTIGLLLIFGLLLHAMTPTGSSAFESLENPPSPLRPGSTDNLMSSSGGEQNIDPFTVNPINRWDSSSSGPLTTSIENEVIK